mmetsp:Transcript_94064/g.266129  ORF Transcript_94064/g.266129 Transcript_94064/m.266129 type:complete len:420 (-) Transcript_94064:101-1360(-)
MRAGSSSGAPRSSGRFRDPTARATKTSTGYWYLVHVTASTWPRDQRISGSFHSSKAMHAPSRQSLSVTHRNLSRKTIAAGIDDVGSCDSSMEAHTLVSKAEISAFSAWTIGRVSGGQKLPTKSPVAGLSISSNSRRASCRSAPPALLEIALATSACSVSRACATMSSTANSHRWFTSRRKLLTQSDAMPPSTMGRSQRTSRHGRALRPLGCLDVEAEVSTAAKTAGVSKRPRETFVLNPSCCRWSKRLMPTPSALWRCATRDWQSTRQVFITKLPVSWPQRCFRLTFRPSTCPKKSSCCTSSEMTDTAMLLRLIVTLKQSSAPLFLERTLAESTAPAPPGAGPPGSSSSSSSSGAPHLLQYSGGSADFCRGAPHSPQTHSTSKSPSLSSRTSVISMSSGELSFSDLQACASSSAEALEM